MNVLLRGARVIDPAHPGSGAVRDLAIAGGRIAEPVPGQRYDEIDARGHVVMAGGIDAAGGVASASKDDTHISRSAAPSASRRAAA